MIFSKKDRIRFKKAKKAVQQMADTVAERKRREKANQPLKFVDPIGHSEGA